MASLFSQNLSILDVREFCKFHEKDHQKQTNKFIHIHNSSTMEVNKLSMYYHVVNGSEYFEHVYLIYQPILLWEVQFELLGSKVTREAIFMIFFFLWTHAFSGFQGHFHTSPSLPYVSAPSPPDSHRCVCLGYFNFWTCLFTGLFYCEKFNLSY